MHRRRRVPEMLIPTLVMTALAVVLVVVGYNRGHGEHLLGLKAMVKMTWEVLPLLLSAFLVAAMVQVLVPREWLAHWIGAQSGLRGVLLGAVLGACAPGGPYVNLPLVAALLRAGAGVGTGVAFLTGWLLWSFSRLPMEVGLLGWRFTLIRLASTAIFPPLAGLIACLLSGRS
jgi:uncharacterized membrane protein YraQ (UPF0718 family)